MAWELKKVEDQRRELVESYVKGTVSMTELCQHYGISRKTAYKWYNRYKNLGSETGLKDRSRAPHHPYCIFNDEDISLAIDLKLKYRTWGPKKILAKLTRLYPDRKWPSATRIYEIFKTYHLVKPKRFRSRVPATQPLGDLNKSNDVWIADFKGWFVTQDGSKCEPLTITDGFSRYLIKCEHLPKKSADYVWPVFAEAFREYGLPDRIRTDNGAPFGCVGVGRLTRLSINLIKAGVLPEWINPGHPEENGRHERFHLTLKEAVACPAAETLPDQLNKIELFEKEYNFERPHEALEMNTPASVYCNSRRTWDGRLLAPEYDSGTMIVRKVGQSGCIWLKQKEYYLGQVLSGEYVGLEESEMGILKVYYGPVYLGALTEKSGLKRPQLKRKKIVRRT